ASKSAATRQLLQVALSQLALKQAEKAPATDLAKLRAYLTRAQEILDHAKRKLDTRRPAEAQYLALLLRDVDFPSSPPPDLLQLGLSVSLDAEEAALAIPKRDDLPHASETVLPWIKARMDAADTERRLGQDWVFGSDDTAWKLARKHLDVANTEYSLIR